MTHAELYTRADFPERLDLGQRGPRTPQEWAWVFLLIKAIDWVMIEDLGERRIRVTYSIGPGHFAATYREKLHGILLKTIEEHREMSSIWILEEWNNKTVGK